MNPPQASKVIPALQVRQWLDTWDDLKYDPAQNRRKPEPHFYLAAMPASVLRALSGIQRRKARRGAPRGQELGIQRRHDVERSKEIKEYVRNGFPWSQLSDQRRESGDYDDLRKPGWLPTAIVVNILAPGDQRQGESVARQDLVSVKATSNLCELVLPRGFAPGKWEPTRIPPLEVIDGQHRLWAFDPKTETDFELPVVAFVGLDVSWQAYLFYSINITPKKINRSLAYDLYPLLRSEDWLDRFEGTPVYRETRSQELTEALWAYPNSPWHSRINMLGERGRNEVTQAAWIRSLMATFVRSYTGRGVRGIGGLFGAPSGGDKLVLAWSSSQQAAFLIRVWQLLQEAIEKRSDDWMKALRREGDGQERLADIGDPQLDAAFAGPFTLLNTDQGVRGFQHVVNDLCYQRVDELRLAAWNSAADSPGVSNEAIEAELRSLRRSRIDKFLSALAGAAAPFDWRTSRAPGLTEAERRQKARFRGSGGYKELRRELTEHLASTAPSTVARPAQEIVELLFSE